MTSGVRGAIGDGRLLKNCRAMASYCLGRAGSGAERRVAPRSLMLHPAILRGRGKSNRSLILWAETFVPPSPFLNIFMHPCVGETPIPPLNLRISSPVYNWHTDCYFGLVTEILAQQLSR
jgi:hypothetical protein